MVWLWETDEESLGAAWDRADEDERQRALLLATSSITMLTLNRVGLPPVTLRPAPRERQCRCPWEPAQFSDGLWLNACGCRTARWYKPLAEIDLPGPVGFIDKVLIDGIESDLDDWRLDNGHLLVWQGSGPSPIPESQDLSKPETEPGTYAVVYSRSYAVDREGRIAVSKLAEQFLEGMKPRGKCDLPRGVRTVTRSGVSFTIEAGLFPNGLTKIDVVDQYILKWAPAGTPSRPAQVFSPRQARDRLTSKVPRRGPSTIPTSPSADAKAQAEFEEGLAG